MKKYEDIASRLRRESDQLRANIMGKEPGFGVRELLPQSFCDYHGEGGHSGSKCRQNSIGKLTNKSNSKPVESKFKKMNS